MWKLLPSLVEWISILFLNWIALPLVSRDEFTCSRVGVVKKFGGEKQKSLRVK